MDEINVIVVDRKRKNLYLRYLDPDTGRPVEKSARTKIKAEAIKAAGKWQAELREGRYQKPSQMTWEAFREYYATNYLPSLAVRTAETYESTLNVFEAKCNPQRLADVTTPRVTAFVTMLRAESASEATIARHLRQLQVAMRWAQKQGLLRSLPQITMPKRARGAKVMRGRAITTEEFERMLASVPKGIEARPNTRGVDVVGLWRFYLQGLWNSGLRLSESLTLRWDYAPNALVVDFSNSRPMLRIPAEVEKGNQDRLLPMAPEFAKFLDSMPEHERRGRVFKLVTGSGQTFKTATSDVSKRVVAIGKQAGVVVDERMKGKKQLRKFASAHDLRRAFGFRWALRVMPAVLKDLMRHRSIDTTMKYYVGQNAEAMADVLWAAVEEGDTLGDTRQSATNRKRVAK